MRAALPVEIDTAGIWLRAGADPHPDSAASREAEAVYTGRVAEDLYLRRSYPDYVRLCAGGFFQWAGTLYGAAAQAIRSYPLTGEGEA